jgi:hypothetical protein
LGRCDRSGVIQPSIRAKAGRRLGAGKAAIADDLTKERAVLEERIEKFTAEAKALVGSIKPARGKGCRRSRGSAADRSRPARSFSRADVV